MNTKFCKLLKIVGCLDVLMVIVSAGVALFGGKSTIDLIWCFRFLLCLLFSVLIFYTGTRKESGAENGDGKERTKSFVFLMLAGIFLALVQNVMLFEELVNQRESIACVIAAIASYTLFDNAFRCMPRNKVVK